jgi:hypothetical protein
LSPSLGGLVFRYLDTLGAPLATPVSDTRAISLIRLDLHGRTKNVTRSPGSSAGRRGDSSNLVVLLRNRR